MKKAILSMIGLLIFGVIVIILIGLILIGLRPCGWLSTFSKSTGCIRNLEHPISPRSVAFAPDGTILATLSFDNTVRVWQVIDGALLYTLNEQAAEEVISIAFMPDGATLVIASTQTLALRRIVDGTLVRSLVNQTNSISDIALTSDGTILATGNTDGTIQLWQLKDGMLLNTLDKDISPVNAYITGVAFSPDNTLLASGSINKTIQVWQVSDGALLHTLKGHTSPIESIAFSPDGTLLASGASDNTVRLWRVSDGTLLHVLEGHRGHVISIAFSPDNMILASGSRDTTVRLWQVSDGTLLHTLNHGGGWFGGWIWDVAFSPNGELLATAQRYGPVRLFDMQQLKLPASQ